MATYDLLMLAILAGLTIYGYFKGLAWQLAYITSLVASYFVAARFADRLAPSLTFANPPVNKFVAMLIIYAGTSLAIWMVFRLVRGVIDKVKLESFDHQMGAIIGALRGVLWCVAVTFFAVTLLPATQKQQIIGSRSGHYIARLLDETESLFPPEVHEVIGPYLDRLGNELNQSGPTGPAGWPGASAQTQPAGGEALTGLVQGFAQQAAAQFAPSQPAPVQTNPPGGFAPSGFAPPAAPRQAAGGAPSASQLGWPQP